MTAPKDESQHVPAQHQFLGDYNACSSFHVEPYIIDTCLNNATFGKCLSQLVPSGQRDEANEATRDTWYLRTRHR